MGADKPTAITVKINGQLATPTNLGGADVNNEGQVIVDDERLYKLIKSPDFLTGALLELEVPQGVFINAFTFGS